MDKLKGNSMDLEKINIKKIKTIFPETVTDGKIDFDKLKEILGEEIDESNEKFNFTWNGKKQAIKLAQKPSNFTLRPIKEESKNWDTTDNLYIEGDNLEVLKQLQKTYFGKIKMIYIDPPYNTGGDFVYKDDFKNSINNYKELTNQMKRSNPETNGRFHTDWLNMMYPRLMLAKNLLTEDGVIFISIDHNELANLINISNEIFGESNFIGNITVESNPKGRKNSDFISVSSDYVIIYAKRKDASCFIDNIPKKAKDMRLDENGDYIHASGYRVLVGENSFNPKISDINSEKNYSVYYRKEDNSLEFRKEVYGYVNKDLTDKGFKKYYSYFKDFLVENTYTMSKFKELFDKKVLLFKENKIYEKNYKDTTRIKSILTNQRYDAIVKGKKKSFSLNITNTGANRYIKKLFNSEVSPFSSPKNIEFIKILISLFEKDQFIVLDFFAGSSSTADAVMRLNFEDGGNRKFIMVQLPEDLEVNLKSAKNKSEEATIKKAISLCNDLSKPRLLTEIGKERIRLAGEQVTKNLKDNNKNLSSLDVGFKVFKLDDTNIKEWDSSKEVDKNTLLNHLEVFKEDRTTEDVLYEILLKYGVFDMPIHEISIDNKKAYDVGKGMMIIALFDEITNKDIELISEKSPRVVIFKDSGFINSSFKENARINLEKRGIEDIKSV